MANSKKNKHRKHSSKKPRKVWKWIVGVLVAIILIIGGVTLYSYLNVKKSADEMYHPVKVSKTRDVQALLKAGKPVSILVMGAMTTDEATMSEAFKGNTDTMMLVTLNAQKHAMTMVNINSTLLTDIPGYAEYSPATIGSAYSFGKAATAIKTVQDYLNVPVDFYMMMNITGFQKLIDQIGGIDVTPTANYSFEGSEFTTGQPVHLDNLTTLKYIGAPTDDPTASLAQQVRMKEVLTATLKKAFAPKNVTNLGLIRSMAKEANTDLTMSDLTTVIRKYNSAATGSVDTKTLNGEVVKADKQAFAVASQADKQNLTDALRTSLALPSAKTSAAIAVK
ncbi:hypothetical protein EQG49_12290 [Periweissella cryptocerci]|uniref:Cell envelope-related transcriptional attenuator domain-containing protein n=1 Tax=Periweissella cryptocerci TaxID=2506420 RepID=A0A4P6YWN0_9LACO|nr:LCP family protein [Periweissella cryptocerci]QBO37177.1 hypothetical protein EQG49_12290 [Periweissella cryptocerci]